MKVWRPKGVQNSSLFMSSRPFSTTCFLAGVVCAYFLGETARAQDNYDGTPPPPSQQYAPPPADDPADQGGPDQSVSFQTFYNALGGEGTWIQTSDYGYVWQPQIQDPNWAPYTDGHWVYTDDGWTWVSDEPWGWATYHYGRWANLDGEGWCWVPGYTWAPAWVSWRYGDGYCGWAPLPPDSMIGIDYDGGETDLGLGFHIGGDCDGYYGIGAGWYTFLPIAYLGDPDYRGYYVNRYNNYRLINRTTNVTNLNLSRNAAGSRFAGVSLGGPSLMQVDAVSQTPIERDRLAFTDRMGGGTVSGHSLAIFAPQVDIGTLRASRPQALGQSLGHISVNHGTDISRPLSVSPRVIAASPTQRQIQQAYSAQAAAPVHAQVATTNNSAVRPVSPVPLTSMRPMVFPSTSYRGGTSYSHYPSSPSQGSPHQGGYGGGGGYHSGNAGAPGNGSGFQHH